MHGVHLRGKGKHRESSEGDCKKEMGKAMKRVKALTSIFGNLVNT